MTRRRRLAVTLVALTMHLLAPLGAYAASGPAAESSAYCSAARADARSGSTLPAASGFPAARTGHSPPSHCPSCPGAFAVVAIPRSAALFGVPQRSLDSAPTRASRAVMAAQPALLPPLRGPCTVLS